MSPCYSGFILFDDDTADQMFPLPYTRTVTGLRPGILTIRGAPAFCGQPGIKPGTNVKNSLYGNIGTGIDY